MHDERFYRTLGPVTAGSLASGVGLEFQGDADCSLVTVCRPDRPCVNGLCFFDGDPKDARSIPAYEGVVITTSECAEVMDEAANIAISSVPKSDFAKAAAKLLAPRLITDCDAATKPPEVHVTCQIGPGAHLGEGCQVGEGTLIGPNAVIGPGVMIGRYCTIGAGAVIEAALIGDMVTVKANAVLGGNGFGLIPGSEGLTPVPHFGRVILQDRSAIGSCTCVDRGVFDDTVIGEGTKLDNLVQIGHNCVIGRNSAIAAFGGISGSVKIGDWVRLGGRVGIADHLTIDDRAQLAADAAVMRDVPAGEVWGGTPAKPLRQMLREAAWLARNAKRRPGGAGSNSS